MGTIVSLTSFGQRVKTTLPVALESLNKQTDFKPDRILLYLTREDYGKIPKYPFARFDNLEIVPTYDDIRSFKKYIALTDRQLDNDTVWIVDDDLFYYDYDYKCFADTYAKYNNPNAVYAFNVWKIKSFDENFYETPVTKSGLVKDKFVIGCNKFYTPKTKRFNYRFLTDAFQTSPTDDDTYMSAYTISNGTPVYKIKLPKGETRNFHQLDIPLGTRKLIEINRPYWKSNVKRNFHRFGLYEPQPLITNLSTPRTT